MYAGYGSFTPWLTEGMCKGLLNVQAPDSQLQ